MIQIDVLGLRRANAITSWAELVRESVHDTAIKPFPTSTTPMCWSDSVLPAHSSRRSLIRHFQRDVSQHSGRDICLPIVHDQAAWVPANDLQELVHQLLSCLKSKEDLSFNKQKCLSPLCAHCKHLDKRLRRDQKSTAGEVVPIKSATGWCVLQQ